MKDRSSKGTSYASLAISTLALLVAAGGTSYAAVALSKDSVTSRHIVDNTITSPDVKNGAIRLKDLAPDARTGQKGPKGDPGQDGTDGAEGPEGPAGRVGPVGPAGKDGKDGLDGVGAVQGLIYTDVMAAKEATTAAWTLNNRVRIKLRCGMDSLLATNLSPATSNGVRGVSSGSTAVETFPATWTTVQAFPMNGVQVTVYDVTFRYGGQSEYLHLTRQVRSNDSCVFSGHYGTIS